MKTLGKTIIVGLTLALMGCSGIMLSQQVNYAVVATMQPDCQNASGQIRYLRENRELNAKFLKDHETADNRMYDKIAAQRIWAIRSECQ